MKKLFFLCLLTLSQQTYTHNIALQFIKVIASIYPKKNQMLLHSIPEKAKHFSNKLQKQLEKTMTVERHYFESDLCMATIMFASEDFLRLLHAQRLHEKKLAEQIFEDEDKVTKQIISRQEARAKIEQCTLAFIDLNDHRTVQEHVEDLEAMLPYLDPNQDQSTIQLIHQFSTHKDITYLATARWTKMLYNMSTDLPEDAPVHPELWQHGYYDLVDRIRHRCNCTKQS